MAGSELGFPFVARADAQVLILGSMPGVRSLEKREYYGHPQNSFWPIMDALFGISVSLSYETRIAKLKESRVALWDVIECCSRVGSLDSNIQPESIRVNDFERLFDCAPRIGSIFFNGKTAEKLFLSRVDLEAIWQRLDSTHPLPTCVALPSTSPAYAVMDRETKIRAWRVVLSSSLSC